MRDASPDPLDSSKRPKLELRADQALVATAAATAAATAPLTDMKDRIKRRWNTKNLSLRLGADAVSAACAAALVAPVISIIDRSIMENASGRCTLLSSLRQSFTTLFRRPHALIFSRPFALIFALYGGTYLTANTLDTATSTVRALPAAHVSAGTAKFAASSAANVGLCIYKDQAFVRLFGPPGALPRPVAPASYALFALRDCLTIFASFNLPPLLGPAVARRCGERWASGQTVAQFLAPAAVQVLSTPVHLLGLDFYNRPSGGPGGAVVPWRERWAAVRRNAAVSTLARMGRIVPAFGVGGVVNMKVRKGLMEKLT